MSVQKFFKELSNNKALCDSSGEYETSFFAPIYRFGYLSSYSYYDRSIGYVVYSTVIKLALAVFLYCELFLTEMSTLDQLADNVNIVVIQIIGFYRYYNMSSNKTVFKELAATMTSPYFDTTTMRRREIVQYWCDCNYRYFKLLLSLGIATMFAWYFYPVVDDLDYNFMIPMDLPFHYQTRVRYTYMYLTMIVFFNYFPCMVIFNDTVIQGHLINLICQFNVLADCFENMLDECKRGFEDISYNIDELVLNEDFRKHYIQRLGQLVEQHKFILTNCMVLRDIISGPMLGQLAASGVLICFIAYQAVANFKENFIKSVMALFYLGYNLSQVFIICRWCEEIKTQSGNVKEAIYRSGWEQGIASMPGVKVRMLLLSARAGEPVVMTAGGMYDMSLESFNKLVKTSYSAFTMLLQVKHD